MEVVLLLAVPALAWVGFRVVLDTTAGQVVDPELDPSEPGYEAFLEPTPVAALVGVDGANALSWVTVLVLGGPGERGGAVLFVPPTTLADEATTLAGSWASGGQPALTASLGGLLAAGFTDVVVVAPERVAELVGPVSPLRIALPEDVGELEAGAAALDGPGAAQLLVERAGGESDLARMARHELVWRAWLDAVAASPDPGAVPGEASAGIGRYVRGLAAGDVTFDVAPVEQVEPVDGPTAGDEIFEPDARELRALVADRVPFPVSATPGGRPRVRVLDAVGQPGLSLRVGRDAARAGGQVVVVGNADRFGATSSRVVYFEASFADAARRIGAALGVLELEQLPGPNPNDAVDLTVVVGADLAGAYGLPGG